MPAFYLSAGRRRRIGQVERAKAWPRGCLSVALGNALNLVLLLDGIAVRGALRRASGRGRSASGLAPGGPGEERPPPGCRPGPPTPQHRAGARPPSSSAARSTAAPWAWLSPANLCRAQSAPRTPTPHGCSHPLACSHALPCCHPLRAQLQRASAPWRRASTKPSPSPSPSP